MSQSGLPSQPTWRYQVPGGWIYHGSLPNAVFVPDPTVDLLGFAQILAAIADLATELRAMSDTQDTIAAEIATLKSNMTGLHTAVQEIQARLTTALAAAANAGTDPAALSDLHAINADLAGIVTGLSPPALTA